MFLPSSKSEGERERIEPKDLIGILRAEKAKTADSPTQLRGSPLLLGVCISKLHVAGQTAKGQTDTLQDIEGSKKYQEISKTKANPASTA